MSTALDFETVVIGGGVIGLAIAEACARKGQETVVLERHSRVGQEISSRSSEVVHAGIYYSQGSLKASACVEGRRRLYEFAHENGVTVGKLGKLIVATSPSEVPNLKAIRAQAIANGVDDLVWLEPSQARDLEPEISCSAALFSPSTGIVDSHAFMQALEGHLLARGGSVVLNAEVSGVRLCADGTFALEVISNGELTTLTSRNLFAAGGLGMTGLSSILPRSAGYEPPCVHFAKGHYFTLQGKAPFRHLIYPVPVEGGLGTHLTMDMQGRARFGPDVQWVDKLDYGFDDAGGRRRSQFEASIRRYWPHLPSAALEPAYTGIRPKITRKGEPAGDFLIHGPSEHGISRMAALYGIESPGLTSSLAIAQYCVGLLP
ncbi:MAG TPA: NAD(P)/FAD-dependent oxidoreductase [Hyphomicrobium sp.]|nr:NAD(P)/FAD-dependent oxidoreductase [Hyphomicrobium sp.]